MMHGHVLGREWRERVCAGMCLHGSEWLRAVTGEIDAPDDSLIGPFRYLAEGPAVLNLLDNENAWVVRQRYEARQWQLSVDKTPLLFRLGDVRRVGRPEHASPLPGVAG